MAARLRVAVVICNNHFSKGGGKRKLLACIGTVAFVAIRRGAACIVTRDADDDDRGQSG